MSDPTRPFTKRSDRIFTVAKRSSIALFALAALTLPLTAYISDQELEERQALAEKFKGKVHLNPMPLDGDPYDSQNDDSQAPASGSVCAVKYVESDRIDYVTIPYENAEQANSQGAFVTHTGPCGTCSSLQDLAVYLEKPDLTTPARRCGMFWFAKNWSIDCFKKIGFSDECAKTWYYNAKNTAKHCSWICIKSLISGEPRNLDNNELNECLQCDEDMSGKVFQKSAGRIRRNTGVTSEIFRPTDQITSIVHDYH